VLAWGPIRYARNGDVSIAYRVGGEKPVDLLFISGFVSHLEIGVELALAQRFFERLGSFARIIAFDKRGMGLSDRDAGAYTLENVVDDALAVLDAAGVERAVVFGVSEGGSAATMLAAAHPHRVSSMALYGAFARLARGPDYPEGIRPDVLEGFVTRMAEEWGQAAMLELWAPRPGRRRGGHRLVGALAALGHEPGRDAGARPHVPRARRPGRAAVGRGADTRPLSRHDHVIRADHARVVARGIPGAQELELAGADHLFVAGDQDAMLDAVEEFVTGRPAAAVRERLLATVLFTDIVRSTEHAAELGDRRWRELLTQHDRIVERELARHRGRHVKSFGDAVFASFDGPARAVRCALAVREGAAAIGLELRAGIHTGECEVVGDDLAGMAVHLAARVQATAKPGEVLTSGTVKDLVVGSGLEFEDRGSHALKGVPGEWPLYAVTGDAERPPIDDRRPAPSPGSAARTS
jgi:class 3 adenylate cyclase